MTEKQLINAPVSVLAVDPGKSGSVCRIGQGQFEILRDFKTLPDIARAVQKLANGVSHVIAEAVWAMPGQGVVSMFSFGRAAGVADGALVLALPHLEIEYVAPLKWQNFYRKRLGILKGQEFNSRQIASEILPTYAHYFRRVLDHNSADSALIAIWKLLQLYTQ